MRCCIRCQRRESESLGRCRDGRECVFIHAVRDDEVCTRCGGDDNHGYHVCPDQRAGEKAA